MVHDPPFDGSGVATEEPLIFVSDSTAEAERLTVALRARGYQVVDVPLGLLAPRVSAQRPSLILCDVDAEGALETAHGLRDIPGGSGIDIVFIGEAGGILDDRADAVFHEGSGLFVRPVDVYALLRKVEGLIGPPPARRDSLLPPSHRVIVGSRPDVISSKPPPTPSSARPVAELPPPPILPLRTASDYGRRPPSGPPRLASRPPISFSSRPPAIADGVGFGFGVEGAPSELARRIPQAEMSPELAGLLSRAEERVSIGTSSPSAGRLSPEEEVEAVLPADVLAALDEPLDADDEDDELGSSAALGTHGGSEGGSTGGDRAPRTAAGDSQGGPRTAAGEPHTRAGAFTEAGPISALEPPLSGPHGPTALRAATPEADRYESEPPATPPAAPTRPPPEAAASGSAAGSSSAADLLLPPLPRGFEPAIGELDELRGPAEAATVPPPGRRHVPSGALAVPALTEQPQEPRVPLISPPQPSLEPPTPLIPNALGPGDAVRALAISIVARYSGAIAFEDAAGIRRVVLRDGDFVTGASGAQSDSLVQFLVERGDLSAQDAQTLGRRVPQFGRHAGAALVAHGFLPQDELWSMLRAHAEWLLGHIVTLESGAASLEREVPGRLQAEPAVFGGATGAEVLVEIARRVVPPDQAVRRLGGESARFREGPAARLLGECALVESEVELVELSKSAALREVIARAGSPDFASVLYALRELGVLETERVEQRGAPSPEAFAFDPIDDEALRKRILSRTALVEDGDYFALLGIGREATPYDIQRAYQQLRHQLDPRRALTATTADLRDELDVILEVLDEAYEILSDDRRRERYRRALEAAPR